MSGSKPSVSSRDETSLHVMAGDEHLTRRRFLRWVSAIGAAISGITVGMPMLRAFFSPIKTKAPAAAWIKAADDIALIDIEVPVRVDFVTSMQDAWVETRAAKSVWLYTEDGENFKAYNGHCTHLGCSFSYDDQSKNFVCPCHRGAFDVKTGKVLAGPPPRGLDELEVEIRDSSVFVKYRDYQLGSAERIEA